MHRRVVMVNSLHVYGKEKKNQMISRAKRVSFWPDSIASAPQHGDYTTQHTHTHPAEGSPTASANPPNRPTPQQSIRDRPERFFPSGPRSLVSGCRLGRRSGRRGRNTHNAQLECNTHKRVPPPPLPPHWGDPFGKIAPGCFELGKVERERGGGGKLNKIKSLCEQTNKKIKDRKRSVAKIK